MAIQKCPHCGARLEVALFDREQARTNGKGKPGTFESVQHMPPHWYNPVRRFLWFFRKGNHYNPGAIRERITVRSEHKPSPQEMLINEMEIPASRGELIELRRVYVDLGYSWSKAATVNNTSLGGKRHDNIKDAFLSVRLLRQIDSTHYELTDEGKRFLVFVSQTQSPAHYPPAESLPYLVKNWPTVSIKG